MKRYIISIISMLTAILWAGSSFATYSKNYSCDQFKYNNNVYQNCLNMQQTKQQIQKHTQDNYASNIQQSQPYSAGAPPSADSTPGAATGATSAAQAQPPQQPQQPQYQQYQPQYQKPNYGNVPPEAGPYVKPAPKQQPSQQPAPQINIKYN